MTDTILSETLSWIAADWGTTNLRVWALNVDNVPIASASSDQGMSSLAGDQFEQALMALIADWLPVNHGVPIIACGMVGARQGWVEAPYAQVPSPPIKSGPFQTAPTRDARLQVRIIPGLCQRDPADVMRGEETQLAGLIARDPAFDGLVCLPGTHSKWVRVSDGEITSFRTFMTGELFALLEQQSILKHSLTAEGFDWTTYRSTLETLSKSETPPLAELFSIRAADLLGSADPARSRAALSARLIAMEVQAALTLYGKQKTILIGTPFLSDLYRPALLSMDVSVEETDAEALTLAGLCLAKSKIEG